MRQVLMRLENGTLIESVVDEGTHGVLHRYAASRDGVTIAKFESIDEVVSYVRDRSAEPQPRRTEEGSVSTVDWSALVMMIPTPTMHTAAPTKS